MKYLEIENDIFKGWKTPNSYKEAVEFAEEVKSICRLESASESKTLVKLLWVDSNKFVYKWVKDGTRFIICYNKENKLIKMKVRLGNKPFDYEDADSLGWVNLKIPNQ